ncbi:unnamed protein product [Dicrocoelium dendriticum]|nr:unnamed protein product [Dicrocoelium dendriticum]
MRCLVVAPVFWDTVSDQSPFVFEGNVLQLDVAESMQVSNIYRIQCDLFNGVLQRTVAVQILRSSEFDLAISGPTTRSHDPYRPGVYRCELVTSPGVDLSDLRNRPHWEPVTSGRVKIFRNVLTVDKSTSPGEHTVDCVYDENGMNLRKRLTFSYLGRSSSSGKRSKPLNVANTVPGTGKV